MGAKIAYAMLKYILTMQRFTLIVWYLDSIDHMYIYILHLEPPPPPPNKIPSSDLTPTMRVQCNISLLWGTQYTGCT